MCLVFSPRAPARSRRWTETTLGLFGCIGKIPDAGIKCLPRHAAEGLAASLGGAMSPAGLQIMVSVGPSNKTNDRTTPAWINETGGATRGGGSEELPVPLQPLC